MGRVDRQRRQNGENLIQEDILQIGTVVVVKVSGPFQHDVVSVHFAREIKQNPLLGHHKLARIFVDKNQLFGGRQAVGGRGHVARLGQFA